MEQNGCKTTVLQPFCQQSGDLSFIERSFFVHVSFSYVRYLVKLRGSARKPLSLDTGMNCVFFLINLLDVFILSIVCGIFSIEVIGFGKRKIHP